MNEMLDEILADVRPSLKNGEVAEYIPELKKADQNDLGVCVMTAKGEAYQAGDWEHEFTMQSIAKTFILLLALQKAGKNEVFKRVGMEASGDAFNSFARLEKEPHLPFNPMINAGAIAAASFCMNERDDPYPEFLNMVRILCGRGTIDISDSVYQSEKKSGKRNRGIAYLMEDAEVLKCDAESALDFYFKACSTLANTKDLAHYALILANNGVNPLNGERLMDEGIAPIIKMMMLTCGMYDASGEFAVKVGLPAKSGVGGGIIACAENHMGIATYGPALNKKGNSLGGSLILAQLSEKLNLHLFSGNVYYQ